MTDPYCSDNIQVQYLQLLGEVLSRNYVPLSLRLGYLHDCFTCVCSDALSMFTNTQCGPIAAADLNA